MIKWVFVGCCHKTIPSEDYVMSQEDHLEMDALNISTKPYDTKNEMLDAVIRRCQENKDKLISEPDINCMECIESAIDVFRSGYPGHDIIQRWAKHFHSTYHIKDKELTK